MSDRLMVATRKGLFFVRRMQGGWKVERVSFLGDNASVMLADPRDGRMYVALGHGHFGVKMHSSGDGGETWEERPAPALPPRREDEEPWIDSMGRVIPESVQLVWALEAGGPEEPGVLWCGTIPGALFRSNDHGATWELVRSLWDHPSRRKWFGGGADWPGIHSICVHPTDSRRLMVGVSCGGVWATEDAAGSWQSSAKGMFAVYMPPELREQEDIQDPHRVVQCAADPKHFWAQHHNGVFRSTDGARTWTEVAVSPSSFGFAVAVSPNDPFTAWLVPGASDEHRIAVGGKVVVARTRDGGRTFEQLRAGLPQEHAYDLTFRHALDVDKSGERLAFGSTTGSLWVSENQGDSWQTVSEHLPPVYAVRFVPTRRQ